MRNARMTYKQYIDGRMALCNPMRLRIAVKNVFMHGEKQYHLDIQKKYNIK